MKRYRLIVGVVLCLAVLLTLPTVGPAQEAKVRASLKAGVMQTLERTP